MDTPLVSVVMPVYNASKFLRAAIDSILNQSFTNFEFVIINDGSTDSSHEIIVSYTDTRIKYINNKKNQGLVVSLNQAINTANGKYVARMDADDIAYSYRLQKQIEFLQENPEIKLLGSHIRLVDEHNKPFDKWVYPLDSDSLKKEIQKSCCFAHPTVVFEKKAFDDLGGYDIQRRVAGEDHDLWKRVLDKYDSSNIDEVLLDYRVHTSSLSSSKLFITALTALALKKKIGFDGELEIKDLTKGGLNEGYIATSISDSFLFWIELYRKMGNYDVCDRLFKDLEQYLSKLDSLYARIKVKKYQIKYNIKRYKPFEAVVISVQYLKLKFIW